MWNIVRLLNVFELKGLRYFAALTSKLPHPAQRDSFVNVYRYLLNKEVPSDRVLFMGDSAGGELLDFDNSDISETDQIC